MLQLHKNTIHWPSGQRGVLTDDVSNIKEKWYIFQSTNGARFTGKEDEFLQADSHA